MTTRPAVTNRSDSNSRRKQDGAGPEPAPGDLRIVQAFLNTGDPETGTDKLSQTRDLTDWLRYHGLSTGGEKVGRGDVERALDMRKGLRALLAAPGALTALSSRCDL